MKRTAITMPEMFSPEVRLFLYLFDAMFVSYAGVGALKSDAFIYQSTNYERRYNRRVSRVFESAKSGKAEANRSDK